MFVGMALGFTTMSGWLWASHVSAFPAKQKRKLGLGARRARARGLRDLLMLGHLVRDEDVLHTVIAYVDDGRSLARFSLASRACLRVATDERLWKAICCANKLCALAQVFERDEDLPQSSAWLRDARQQYAFPTVDTLALAPNGWRSFFSNRRSYARVAALLRGTQGHWFYEAQVAKP